MFALLVLCAVYPSLSYSDQGDDLIPDKKDPKFEIGKASLEQVLSYAKQGDVKAQYRLAVAYQNGELGVEQSFVDAARWYERAARLKYAPAQFEVGKSYLNGRGIKQDYYKGLTYLRLANEQGFEDAGLKLKSVESYLQNEASLKTIYRRELIRAKENNTDSQYKVARICDFGLGVKQDSKRAMTWYLKAAENGNPKAQSELANIYTKNNASGVLGPEAILWIEKAANNGHAEAQYKLAKLFQKGGELPKDIELAFEWMKASAVSGNAKAQHEAAKMYINGEGTVRNYEQAVKFLERSVAQGNDASQGDLDKLNYLLDDLYLQSLEK